MKLSAFVVMPFGGSGEYSGGSDESDYVYKEIITPAVHDGVRKASEDFKLEKIKEEKIKAEKIRSEKNKSEKLKLDRFKIEKSKIDDFKVDDLKVEIIRESDKNQGGSITASIVRHIATSDIVIVDITGRNANVFLELGFRYALKNKITIIIAQEGSIIPFDIAGYRYVSYKKFRPQEARNNIAAFVYEGLSGNYASDSVVFDIYPALSVHSPGDIESYGRSASSQTSVMPFAEYILRITQVCELLQPIAEGRLVIDALLGITNGGLVAADLIGRRIIGTSGTPVLSLWARRQTQKRNSAYWLFENEYNSSMLLKIKELSDKGHSNDPCCLLLVDDHAGTGQTATQAIDYIRKTIGEETKILFIPLFSRREDFVGNLEECLPYKFTDQNGKNIFSINKEQFLDLVSTKYSQFPYLQKEIRASTSGR